MPEHSKEPIRVANKINTPSVIKEPLSIAHKVNIEQRKSPGHTKEGQSMSRHIFRLN